MILPPEVLICALVLIKLRSTRILQKLIIQDISVISANLMTIYPIQPDELLIKIKVPKATLWDVPHLRILLWWVYKELTMHRSFITQSSFSQCSYENGMWKCRKKLHLNNFSLFIIAYSHYILLYFCLLHNTYHGRAKNQFSTAYS